MENAEEKQSADQNQKEQTPPPLPAALQRPLVPGLTRLLAGRPVDEEIIDPANPNLIMDRDRA